MRKAWLAAFTVAGMFLTGCSSDSGLKPIATRAAELSTVAPGKSLASPQALSDAAEFSENIYDLAKAAEWDKASAKTSELRDSVARWPKQSPAGDSGVAEALSALDGAVAARGRNATMRIANRLTLLVADKQSQYRLPVPIEIVKLDYYGRELEIWAEANDRGRLQETASAMMTTWEAVRPGIEAHGGKEAAAKFSKLMATTATAKSSSDYRKLAAALLEQVDALEAVYHPAP